MVQSALSPRQKPGKPEALPKVETILQTTYKPVRPRQDFVAGLKNKLEDPGYRPPSMMSNLDFLILIGLAFTTTLVVVIGAVRFVFLVGEALRIVDLFKPSDRAASISAFGRRTPDRPGQAG